jgi:hypothetical protein
VTNATEKEDIFLTAKNVLERDISKNNLYRNSASLPKHKKIPLFV